MLFGNGAVRFEGPQSEEQQAYYKRAYRRRQEAQENLSYFAKNYRRSRSAERKASYLEEWHSEQRMFDIINDSMRGRHKMTLEDRSYREGASREGEAHKEVA